MLKVIITLIVVIYVMRWVFTLVDNLIRSIPNWIRWIILLLIISTIWKGAALIAVIVATIAIIKYYIL